ncbi:hypothetical protein F5Y10DRAFT_237019 [Nemania abortiva]|nr:hypothetical protein F5Y10DRAFT_237019 [Nemania abortiva]
MFHHPKSSDDVLNRSLHVDLVEAMSRVKDGFVIDEHFLGMTPLNDVRLDDHEYDCVAMSGIGSHPLGSWLPHNGDKQFMWIRDVLPKVFPSVRALIYGYDTELCNSNSFQRTWDLANTFIDHLRVVFKSSTARRSIILIAHSLGGIVVKQALVMLAYSEDPTETSLLKAISGVVFFGVPNRGMVISHLVALASGRPNNFLIEQIKENAPFVTRLENEFAFLSQQGELFSQKNFFWGYETQESAIPMRNPNDGEWTTNHPDVRRTKFVERDSATRGLWKDPQKRHFTFQIDKDHSSMVKYANAHDSNLTVVIEKLSELFEHPLPHRLDVLMSDETCIQSGGQLTSGFATKLSATTSPSKTWGFPSDRSNAFKLPSESLNKPEISSLYDRGAELAALVQILDGDATNSRLVASVYGAPGIGKTQLVAHYVKNHRDAYDNVFYIDGSNLDRIRSTLGREISRIRQSWSQFFSALRSGDTHSSKIERFCTFLNKEGNTKWLLVIDEMQDSPWVTPIFDQLKQGTVILVATSCRFTEKSSAVRVVNLSPTASDQLLIDLRPESIAEMNYHELLLRLDFHPMLIRIAAPKLMGFKTLSIFLNHWQGGGMKLPVQTLEGLNRILQTEFNGALPTSQIEILNLCLLFDYKAISYEFLEYLGISGLESFFNNTIQRLAWHGIVEAKPPGHQSVTCSFSELLYQFLRQSVVNWDAVMRRAASLLAEKVPRSHKDNYRERIELLAPHAVMFSKYIHATRESIKSSAEFLDNLERIASLLRLLDKGVDAIKLYNFIHQENEKLLKLTQLTPLRTAEVYNNMGLSFVNEGDMKLALSCFGKAKHILPWKGNRETLLQIIANEARALMEMEEYAGAESLLSTQLENNKFRDEVALMPLKHVLGLVHIQMGRSDLGIPLLEECRSVSESEHLGVGKRVIFTIMHDLATAWRDQKRWDDAITLYEKTKEYRESFHGPAHRYTIETTGALAVAYQGSGQVGKAAACFKKTLKWQREQLRLSHPDTLQTLQNYGIFLSATKDPAGAKKALWLAYRGWMDQDEKIKKTTWNRINSGASLALVLQDLGEYKAAEALYNEALAWYRESQTQKSPRMAYQYSKTLYLAGKLYEATERALVARGKYERATEVRIAGDGKASYWKDLAARAMHNLKSHATEGYGLKASMA